MPKLGLSDSEWRRRLQSYANGQFSFGRGERPRKGSKWSQRLEAIDKCPKHQNTSTVDGFGRKISCKCGFHSSVPGHSQPEPDRPHGSTATPTSPTPQSLASFAPTSTPFAAPLAPSSTPLTAPSPPTPPPLSPATSSTSRAHTPQKRPRIIVPATSMLEPPLSSGPSPKKTKVFVPNYNKPSKPSQATGPSSRMDTATATSVAIPDIVLSPPSSSTAGANPVQGSTAASVSVASTVTVSSSATMSTSATADTEVTSPLSTSLVPSSATSFSTITSTLGPAVVSAVTISSPITTTSAPDMEGVSVPFSSTGRNPTDYSTRLPLGWMTNLPKADAQWIGQTLSGRASLQTSFSCGGHPHNLAFARYRRVSCTT